MERPILEFITDLQTDLEKEGTKEEAKTTAQTFLPALFEFFFIGKTFLYSNLANESTVYEHPKGYYDIENIHVKVTNDNYKVYSTAAGQNARFTHIKIMEQMQSIFNHLTGKLMVYDEDLFVEDLFVTALNEYGENQYKIAEFYRYVVENPFHTKQAVWNPTLHPSTSSVHGATSGGFAKKDKTHITYQNTTRLVRVHKKTGLKYIRFDSRDVFLKDIRGRYRYVPL